MSAPSGISGFTILRNGVRFDYPFRESILSALPLVDEFVIALGQSDDGTREALIEICREHPKVRFFDSPWALQDQARLVGGSILAEQTNIALGALSKNSTWALYLQADEVLSEQDADALRRSTDFYRSIPEIEGLVFDYVHFYGSFDVIQQTRSAYRREVRVVRLNAGAESVGDAQSFRHKTGRKLTVAHSGAQVFHYGWVREPHAMREKTFHLDQLYHGEPSATDSASGTPHSGDNYAYKRHWGLRKFTGQHPTVMARRISQKNWHWDLSQSKLVFGSRDLKRVALDLLERATGRRFFEYRCYRIVDDRFRRSQNQPPVQHPLRECCEHPADSSPSSG